jgi:hypothetical protein
MASTITSSFELIARRDAPGGALGPTSSWRFIYHDRVLNSGYARYDNLHKAQPFSNAGTRRRSLA